MRPSRRSRSWIHTIATLITSAAVPCITVFTASRSPSERVWRFEARSSGSGGGVRERRDVAVRCGVRDRPRDQLLHARESRQVGVDQFLRLVARDAEVLGEPERRDAVDDPEVDHLRGVALTAAQLRLRDAEHLRRSRRVDVLPAGERLAEDGLAGDVREDPELDLAVVRGQQASLVGDERRADALPEPVRTGIDCRFGLVVESRPVAATAWLIVVSRPSRSSISSGSGRR